MTDQVRGVAQAQYAMATAPATRVRGRRSDTRDTTPGLYGA